MLFFFKYYGDWVEGIKDFICYVIDFWVWLLYILLKEDLSWKLVLGVIFCGDVVYVIVLNGEGVNFVMVDVLELVISIVQYGVEELNEVVVEYEKGMFGCGVEMIVQGEMMIEVMFVE